VAANASNFAPYAAAVSGPKSPPGRNRFSTFQVITVNGIPIAPNLHTASRRPIRTIHNAQKRNHSLSSI
jgi:hypothetical protein